MASLFKRGSTWHIAWRDHKGVRRTKTTGHGDKPAAWDEAQRIQRDVDRRKAGLIDENDDRRLREARRPIAEIIEEFRATLTARQRTGKHVEHTARHVTRVLEIARVERIPDITPSAITRALAQLLETGLAPRTYNAHLRSVKSFTRWLHADRRTPDDPLVGLTGLNEETDRRHSRRVLSPEEIRRLIATTESDTAPGRLFRGADRAMLYRVALGTGFRASELRSLTPESFRLSDDPPTITVRATHSKRRRTDVQPIRRDLAEILRPWIQGKEPGLQVFHRMPQGTARMMRDDLAAARDAWIQEAQKPAEQERRAATDFLAYENRDGERADFHALRHTYISALAQSGASVKTLQELARHSSPVITIGRYSHIQLHDKAGALEVLPPAEASLTDSPEPARATGTTASADILLRAGCNLGHNGTQLGNPGNMGKDQENTPESRLRLAVNHGEEWGCEPEGGEKIERRRPDSNRGWRICNPLP